MDIENYLRQFRVRDPGAGLKERVLGAALQSKRPKAPLVFWPAAAAAAILVFAAGWRTFFADRTPDDPIQANLAIQLFDGRGRVIPVGKGTRVSVIDARRGLVQLDEGEIYVELSGEGVRAEVKTPAGTAAALGTRFCAHYTHTAQPVLAVAVLDGLVKVSNAHGHAVGDAGEMVLVSAGSAPERHSEGAGRTGCPHHGSCPFASVLSLVYRSEVQAELDLDAEQKARLHRPGKDELAEICRFFRSLQPLAREEWSPRAAQFCGTQQKRVADVLNEKQQKRLREISLQQEGLFALARPAVADRLQLDDRQRRTVDNLLKDFSDAHRAVVTKQVTGENIRASLTELRQQTLRHLSDLLGEAQQKEWQVLLGEPFSLPRRTPHPWYQ